MHTHDDQQHHDEHNHQYDVNRPDDLGTTSDGPTGHDSFHHHAYKHGADDYADVVLYDHGSPYVRCTFDDECSGRDHILVIDLGTPDD